MPITLVLLLYTLLSIAHAYRTCPTYNGLQFEACGVYKCFNPLKASCNNGTVVDLPIFTGPVILQAYNPTAPWHEQYIQASGRTFHIGGFNSAYCPSNVPGSLCHDYNLTVIGGSSLVVYVPGGQQTYIDTSGALRYTGAHSISKPNLQYEGGGVALSGGAYLDVNGTGWIACPHANSETPVLHSEIVAANSQDINGTCTGLYVKAISQPEGTFGAWQYL